MTGPTAFIVERLRQAVARAPYLSRVLTLSWQAGRGWTVLWAVLLLVQGVLPVATVYLTRSLVDRLVAAGGVGGGWSAIAPVLIPVGLIAAIMLATEVVQIAVDYTRSVQSELLQDHINGLVHTQSLAVDLSFYDLPDYYDHLHRARIEATYRPAAILESTGNLVASGVTLAAMGAVLVPFGFWLPIALLLSTLPAFFVVLHHSLIQHQWLQTVTPRERRSWYYDGLMTESESAVELRLFDLGWYFHAAYQAIRRQLRSERRVLARRKSVADLVARTVALAISAAAIAWMVLRTLRGAASLGDLALFYQAFSQGQRMMHSLLQNVGQLYYNSLFLGNLFEFLALRPKVVDPPAPQSPALVLRDGIRFEGVRFRYPGSDRVALEEFNLHVPAERIVALVGPNGAGKSTLVKLLCRFYDPEAGSITLEGVDLRAMRLGELRQRIAALFQQPVHYQATVAENIALGEWTAAPPRSRIVTAAEAAGADRIIDGLPGGYDQVLGKRFAQGTELSVGQWQRLSLARAFLRDAPILILDEPTSAMDPWAESDWLRRFRTLAAGRTAIIITHRFTTAMHADTIHVVNHGRIEESGSHEELLAAGGGYARSWLAQMQGAHHFAWEGRP